MEQAVGRLGERSFLCRSEIVLGPRVASIVDHARRERSDLIILSSHPVRAGHPATDWFTISYRVAILAPCTVLLTK